MTALAKDRTTDQYGVPDEVDPSLIGFPVAAATTLYGGSLIATNASGYAVAATASTAIKVWGRCEKQVVNTTAAGFGSAGDLNVTVRQGAFYFADGTGDDAITFANVGALCYVIDDQTVGLTSGAGLRPACGVILNVRADGQVAVRVGGTSLYDDANPADDNSSFRARGVGPTSNVSDLTAFTVASNDGITYVAGEVALLYAQTSAPANGPYVVGTVSGGTAALTRPAWWPTGATMRAGTQIEVGGDGTLFKNTSWKICPASAAIVIGTDSAALFPSYVGQQVTLNSGTVSITNVPILSATKTVAIIDLITATTATSTFLYSATSFTASTTGNGTVVVRAKETAVTQSTLDGSTLNVGIVNW